MKKLLGILVICLISAPAFAWQEFDGTITDTVTFEYATIEHEHVDSILLGTATIDPSLTPLEALRVEMGLAPTQPSTEAVPGVHAYDAYDDHIGLLLSINLYTLDIFINDIETILSVDARTGALANGGLVFESDDCTGTPLFMAGGIQYKVIRICDQFYTGKRVVPKFRTIHSVMSTSGGRCSCEQRDSDGYFVKAIRIPTREIGLYFPIELPLTFQAWSQPSL